MKIGTFGNIGIQKELNIYELIDLAQEYKNKLQQLENRKKELIKQNKFNELKNFYLRTKKSYINLILHYEKRIKELIKK